MKRRDPNETIDITVVLVKPEDSASKEESKGEETVQLTPNQLPAGLSEEPPSQDGVDLGTNSFWIRDKLIPWFNAHQAIGSFTHGEKRLTLGSGETVTWRGTLYKGYCTGWGGYKNKVGDEWFGHYLKDEKVGQHRSFRPNGTIQISEHKAKRTFGKCTLYATDGSISNMLLLNGDVN